MCRFRHRKHYSGDTLTPKLQAPNGISGPDTRAYVHRKHPVRTTRKTAAEVASLIVTQKHRSHTRFAHCIQEAALWASSFAKPRVTRDGKGEEGWDAKTHPRQMERNDGDGEKITKKKMGGRYEGGEKERERESASDSCKEEDERQR